MCLPTERHKYLCHFKRKLNKIRLSPFWFTPCRHVVVLVCRRFDHRKWKTDPGSMSRIGSTPKFNHSRELPLARDYLVDVHRHVRELSCGQTDRRTHRHTQGDHNTYTASIQRHAVNKRLFLNYLSKIWRQCHINPTRFLIKWENVNTLKTLGYILVFFAEVLIE